MLIKKYILQVKALGFDDKWTGNREKNANNEKENILSLDIFKVQISQKREPPRRAKN